MAYLMERYPEGRIELLRMARSGSDVWVETEFRVADVDIAAVIIFEVDGPVIRRGRYYSERVDPGGPAIEEWLEGRG